MARVVAPGVPHHITQRGNRRQRTFFGDDDYETYVGMMAASCAEHGVAVWAWCLMPNHVHLVAVPKTAEGLASAVGRAHWRYTRAINFREGWRGYLWQGRFASCAMDAVHTLTAARYIERNPVRAGLVERAWEWPWSSARAHVQGKADALVAAGGPLVAEVNDWRRSLEANEDEATLERLRRHARTGRPLGDPAFIAQLEAWLDRRLHLLRPGPKPKRKR